MAKDILEEIVGDYLKHKGYFIEHNVKYRPGKGQYSDIDVIGVHPNGGGDFGRVVVVNCKSWMDGLDLDKRIEDIKNGKDDAIRDFRELAIEEWTDAFKDKIENLTGADSFTHVTAVTKIVSENAGNSVKEWERHWRNLGNPIKVWSLNDMLNEIYSKIETDTTSSTSLGRMLQLIKASEWSPPPKEKKDSKKRMGQLKHRIEKNDEIPKDN